MVIPVGFSVAASESAFQTSPTNGRTCRLYQVLKPGGRILITDYCRSDSTPSDHFAAYIKQRGYDLHPVEKYGRMLKDAGFTNVVSEDITHMVSTLSL